jgi:hypothetical protein
VESDTRFRLIKIQIDWEIDALLDYEPSNLCYISVPKQLIGSTFGTMYSSLSCTLGIIPVAILREELNEILGNKLPFVYTNPPKSLLLLENDLIYVLATPSQIF